MKSNIILSVTFLLGLSLDCSASQFAKDITELEILIAGGNINGVYYAVATQICNIVREYSPTTKCNVAITSGSAENLALLNNNKVDFAIIQEDIAQKQAEAHEQYSYSNMRFVFNLFDEDFTLMSRSFANITSIDELAGKTIGTNLNGVGAKNALQIMVDHAKLITPPKCGTRR